MKTFDRADDAATFFAEAQQSGEVWLYGAGDGDQTLVALDLGRSAAPVVGFWSSRDRLPRLGDLAAQLTDARPGTVSFEEWRGPVLDELEQAQLHVLLNPGTAAPGDPVHRVRRMLDVWLAARAQEVGVSAALAGSPHLLVGYEKVPWRVRMGFARSVAVWPSTPDDRGREIGGLIPTKPAHAVPVNTPDQALCGARIQSVDVGSTWPDPEARSCDACQALVEEGAGPSSADASDG